MQGKAPCSEDGDVAGTRSWPRLPAASFPSPPVPSCPYLCSQSLPYLKALKQAAERKLNEGQGKSWEW